MHQRKLPHVIAAGLLVAVLALPAPVHAASQTRGTIELWDWLTGVWERGIAALWVRDGGAEKQGLGIDPNGQPAPVDGEPDESTAPLSHGIDPNGDL